MEVGCFEKVVEALRLVKEQAKEVGLVPIACSLPLSKHVPKEIRNDNPWPSAPVFGG